MSQTGCNLSKQVTKHCLNVQCTVQYIQYTQYIQYSTYSTHSTYSTVQYIHGRYLSVYFTALR